MRVPPRPDCAGLRRVLTEHAAGLVAYFLQRDAEAFENAGGDAFAFAEQPDEQVFGADVAMVEAAGLVDGELDDFLGTRGQADLAGDRFLAAADDELDGGAHFGELDAEVGEDAGGDTFRLAHEAQEDVLGADVIVIKPLGLFLGKREDSAGTFGEFFEPASHRPCSVGVGWVPNSALGAP